MGSSDGLISILLAHREKLLGFLRRRLDDPSLAEDILQDSLLKALLAAPTLRADSALLPWFYRILHNAIVDQYRRQGASDRRMREWQREQDEAVPVDEATSQELCECFLTLLPAIKEEYGDVIRRLDLSDESPEIVAAQLGISRNNLKVRHHRARTALRRRLEETCRTCAAHGCLDCTCRQS